VKSNDGEICSRQNLDEIFAQIAGIARGSNRGRKNEVMILPAGINQEFQLFLLLFMNAQSMKSFFSQFQRTFPRPGFRLYELPARARRPLYLATNV
jgi:hypothetical protein